MAEEQKAVFAGGCFWCMEPPFDKLDGVLGTVSGYYGGKSENANYERVSSGKTKHREVIQVTFNPQKVDYKTLLRVFWSNIDPFDPRGQFCDKGYQYSAAILAQSDTQYSLAKESLDSLEKKLKKTFAVKVEEPNTLEFYPAEDYHQNYYQKNPLRYKYYRYSCGRDKRLAKVWENELGETALASLFESKD
jgi:peptide-methionine (S)-S-oxide reductase